MPKIRDILIHVSVQEVQRQRKCRRETSRTITKGERCLVVKTNPTNDDYSYSKEHAKPMLDLAWGKLQTIYAALGLTPPA
jgi:hypothetical protein